MNRAFVLRIIVIAVLSILLFSLQKGYMQSLTSNATSYSKLLEKIIHERDSINRLFHRASESEKKHQLFRTEEYLIDQYYNKLLPFWMGTKWEFYGETQIPKDSSIACGHFVVTTLKHLGMRLENSHEMATNFSAYMVNSLCDSSYKVYKPEELLKIVNQRPDDVWVVGLHNHSGLLVKYKGQIRFVHSSYSYPTAVIDESAEESHTFQHSTIYVAGNLFKNNGLTLKWIKSEEVRYSKKY